MRILVVFFDLTVPASRKANPPWRKKTMQLLMRTKKVSRVSLISFSVSPFMPGVDVLIGDWVEVGEMPVVRLARTVVVVEDIITSVMVVMRFVGICSVLEKISVVPPATASGISVDILSCSVANISARNPVTFSTVSAIVVSREIDLLSRGASAQSAQLNLQIVGFHLVTTVEDFYKIVPVQ